MTGLEDYRGLGADQQRIMQELTTAAMAQGLYRLEEVPTDTTPEPDIKDMPFDEAGPSLPTTEKLDN